MARALWKGTIAFGLVSIPVELHTAVRDHRPRFRMLHARDHSPVRFQRVCVTDGKPVAWEDLVKGYEYEKGRFVVLTREDFQAAAVEKTKTVDIIDFVDANAIDDRYFETPYYLVPGKGGDRAYALLREAIRASGRVGIARFILRDAQHLAAVEVIGDALVLSLMRFADELTDLETFNLPEAGHIRPAELEMAKALVNSLAADWDPAKYNDQYRDNLLKIIKAKMKGKTIALESEQEPRQAEVIDLMERLRQSLAQAGATPRAGGAGKAGRAGKAGGAARGKTAARAVTKRRKKAAA